MRAFTLACAMLLLPVTVAAQGISVAPHLGTLGFGADVAVGLSEVLSLRAGGNFQPYSPEIDASDLQFKLDLPSPSFSAMVDVHPGGRSFRLSAGAVYFGSDLELDAVVEESLDIGNGVYTPAEIGTLLGRLVTNSMAPYVGIGFGNAWNPGTKFFLDVGVAFHSTPEVELSATGPIASDPGFQADLDLEVAEIEDDIGNFSVYPVVSLGVSIPVGAARNRGGR